MKTLPVLRDEAPSPLPPLYAAWVAEFMAEPLPTEPHATCSACAMAPPAEGAAVSEGAKFFDPATRCCTYHPNLPNFLVGRVLRDPSIAPSLGADVLMARVASRAAVSPLGIDAPDDVRERYLAVSMAGDFGLAKDLQCPHLLVGATDSCGIWRHRNAACATWYCKHARGGRAARFWKRLRDLLTMVETCLARWCVLELCDDAALSRLVTTSTIAGDRSADTDRGTAAWNRAVWGQWAGRERAFFEACAARVEALRWSDVAAICGADAALGVRLVRHAMRVRDADASSSVLRLGAIEAAPCGDGTVVVCGYSDFDPVTLPEALLAVLSRFDGRPTDDVLAALAEEGISLEPALITTLVDFEILVPG